VYLNPKLGNQTSSAIQHSGHSRQIIVIDHEAVTLLIHIVHICIHCGPKNEMTILSDASYYQNKNFCITVIEKH